MGRKVFWIFCVGGASTRATRTRVRDELPDGDGLEARACLDDPDWIEVLGCGGGLHVCVEAGRIARYRFDSPAEATERVHAAIDAAMRSTA